MMKFLSFVPLASLLLFGITDAFTINPMASSAMKQKTSALQVSTETFYRALECAEGHSCDVSELDKLASELEQFVGCTYEEDSSKEVCEKEIQDRMDLAEILRLKVELKLRLDYLKSGNLFADDVRKDHDLEERKKFKETLLANRDKGAGSDLGLW